jgi:hypothetical protein
MKARKLSCLGFPAALASCLLILSCLPPIGFNPDFKLSVDTNVSGEISIDSINSAEVQIRNHTKSIDVYKVNFTLVEDNESNPLKYSTSARITGAPIAGSQEAVLLRPMSPGPEAWYEIGFWYKQSASCPAELNQPNKPLWDFGSNGGPDNPDEVLTIAELPRGKYVIHVYRKIDGSIGISVEDDNSSMAEMNDNHSDQDFVSNVKVNTNIDLSGANIFPSGGISVNSEVRFSNETTVLFNSLLSAINANRLYPNGYGALVVRNHTSETISNILFEPKDSQSSHIVGLPGVVRPEDQDWIILAKGKWEAQLTAGTIPVGGKNVLVDNGAKSYLHIYKNKNGGYSFIVDSREWSGDLILSLSGMGNDAPDSSYSFTVNVNFAGSSANLSMGALYVHNMTTKAIDNPKFKLEMIPGSASPLELMVGAKATLGGMLDPGNWKASVGSIETTAFVSPLQPTHVYYYKTNNGGYGIADHWPPADADQSGNLDIDLTPDQGAILIRNKSGKIVEYFTWMSQEYRIELTSGDEFKAVVEAGQSTIGFKIMGGSYGHFVSRTINPGQTITITVEGDQIVAVNPPVPPPYCAACQSYYICICNPCNCQNCGLSHMPNGGGVGPASADQTVTFIHETGYDTPIQYLVLYREKGIPWRPDTNNGYPGINSGIYIIYDRRNDNWAPNSSTLDYIIPRRPTNDLPSRNVYVASPIPGLDLSSSVSPLDALTQSTRNNAVLNRLGTYGDYAAKVLGTQTGTVKTIPKGKNHPSLEVVDSVIIEFDPPLARHESYTFKVDKNYNWFVAWLAAPHGSASGIRYTAGYDDCAWFIMRPEVRNTNNIRLEAASGNVIRYR